MRYSCALLLLASVARGQLQRDTQRVSVLLTISGGVSLGSYEAGLNWGLLEVFKLTARDSLRRVWNLPRYNLRVVTGASAGNINGFLAAIEWCRTSAPTAPEQSLLWKVWVRTGIDQLFPLERYDQDDTTKALFSRRYFDRVLFDSVRAAMDDVPASTSPHECTIPVGATITRVAPESVAIAPGLYARTQRYAAVVLLSNRGRTLEFRAPSDEALRNGAFGALLRLPDCHGVIDHGEVFSLIEASSAFPGAFAPVWLNSEPEAGSGCGRAPHDSALFSDGGIFDNNPIDLAAGIYDETIWKNPRTPDANSLLLFIDPDRVSGRLGQTKLKQERPPPATGGIASLLDLFAGAVPAARQYELQAFGRLLARAPGVFARENIKTSARGFLVVGERLGSFAAFLGKPFREYDFYLGTYDALAFFAGEACRGGAMDSLCIKRRLHELVETHALDLGAGPLPRTVLRSLYQREWQARDAAASPPIGGDPTAPPRDLMVQGLLREHFRLEDERFDNARCRSGDPIVGLLCRDGFRTLLGRFANDTVRRAVGRAVGRGKTCGPDNWLESPIRCDMDQSFERFVDNPERFLAGKLGLMLHQLWKVERARKRAGQENWAGFAALSEAVFQSGIAYRYRRGFDLNTSSVPQRAGKAWLATLLPNYVSINTKSRGFELGYRPTVHLTNSWAFALDAVPLHLTGNAASQVDRYRWAIGPALHWKRTSTVWSGLETGVEWFGRWQGNSLGAERVWSIPVNWYLLADKLRIGVRVFPRRDSGVQGAPSADFSVGLADVNGLLYWMLRRS